MKPWKEILADFRFWSFGQYYHHCFATESSPTIRFVKSLIASTRPIFDAAGVISWYENGAGKQFAKQQQVVETELDEAEIDDDDD